MLGRECTNVLYKKIVSNLLALCKPSQSDVPRKGQTPVCDAPWARLKNARGTALYNVVSEDETAVETSLQPANHSLWWHWRVAPVYQLHFVLAGKKATSDMAVVLYFRLPKHAAWRKTYHGWLALTGDKQSIKTIKRNRLVGQWLTSESTARLTSLFIWEHEKTCVWQHFCKLAGAESTQFCLLIISDHTAYLQQQVPIAFHYWWASCNLTDNPGDHLKKVLQVMLATYWPVPLNILQVWTAYCAEKWSHCVGYCSQTPGCLVNLALLQWYCPKAQNRRRTPIWRNNFMQPEVDNTRVDCPSFMGQARSAHHAIGLMSPIHFHTAKPKGWNTYHARTHWWLLLLGQFG